MFTPTIHTLNLFPEVCTPIQEVRKHKRYANTRNTQTQEVRLQENNFPAYQSWLLTYLLNSLTGVQLSCNTHLKLSLGIQADEKKQLYTQNTHPYLKPFQLPRIHPSER